MKYRRFEDLPAWQAAIEMGLQTFALTATGLLDGYAGLRDQIERAAVSVSNNIAEGFDRGTHEELLAFLYYSLGSAGEVRSMLHLIERLPGAQGRRPDIQRLRDLTVDLSRQLGAWVESLKNTDKKGPRYQNQATRATSQSARKQNAFLSELRRIVEESKAEAQHAPDQRPEAE